MMTLEQAQVVAAVLKRFNDSETREWTELDEYMCNLDFLEDKQICIEAAVIHDIHCNNDAHCVHEHPRSECFVPVILEAVDYILQDFEDTKRLAKKARYILTYYVAFSHTGGIVMS